MKFGGTSVADAEAMRRVIAIVRRERERHPAEPPPVVVVSAMSKVTDRLIETGRLATVGEAAKAETLLSELLDRHMTVAASLVGGAALDELTVTLRRDFAAL